MTGTVEFDSANFIKGMRAWHDRFNVGADKAVRAVASRMFEAIVRRTPVDTGWARSNWYASLGKPLDSVPGDAPEGFQGASQNAAISQIAAVISQGKAGDVFWLQNGAPYIQRLEHGHSAQAPEGMVQITMSEVQAFFAQYMAEGAR